MKKTKTKLGISLVTMLLTIFMLLGSTYAWFTDSVSNTGNKIKAGTLDVDLQLKNDTGYVSIDGDANPVFNYEKWEPGYSDAKVFKVVNNGNLAFKYELQINLANGELELNSNGHSLADVIDVYFAESTSDTTIPDSFAEAKTSLIKVGTLSDVVNSNDAFARGILLPENGTGEVPSKYTSIAKEKETYVAVVLHMQEEAGNEYQGMQVGANFDIKLLATQVEYEKDGFNSNTYDAQAELPIKAATKYVQGQATTIQLFTGNNKLAAKAVIPATADIPAETEEIVMEVNYVEKPAAITIEEDQKSLNVDISFYAVKSNGTKTQITDFGTGNIVSVDLSTILTTGYGLVKVYNTHDPENPTEFTKADSKVGLEEGEFFYETSTKTMYLASSKYSPFTFVLEQYEVIVTKDNDNTFAPVGMSFVEFRKSILDTQTYNYYLGYTATLQKDIDLTSADMSIFGEDKSLFAGTFDGDNHSISNFNMICEDEAEVYVSMFYYMYNATVKDLTIKNSTLDHAGNCSSLLVFQPYGDAFTLDNLQIKNCKIKNGWNSAIVGYAVAADNFIMKNCSIDENSSIENIYGSFASAFFNQTCYNESVTITNCTNKADVKGRAYTGAFFCQVGAYITGPVVFEKCTNEGNVYSLGRDDVGTNYTGGFVGYHNSGNIGANASISYINCTNSGSVTGDPNTTKAPGIGGFVGFSNVFDVTFTNCSVSSNQLGKNDTLFCGGYIGWMNGGTVTFDNCSMACNNILGVSGKVGNYVGLNPNYATINANCNPNEN